MAKNDENTGFVCLNCGSEVKPVTNGSYRNHCPFCLWSQHVDLDRPGDRRSSCRALMKPVRVIKKKKGWQIVHQCTACNKIQPNKLALLTVQDDLDAVLEFMQQPTPATTTQK